MAGVAVCNPPAGRKASGSQSRLPGRQREKKRASPTSPVVRPHPSAMPLDDALRNIETESDAPLIMLRQLNEPFKHHVQLVHRDASPVSLMANTISSATRS